MKILFRGKRIDGEGWTEGCFFTWFKYGMKIPFIGQGVQNGAILGFEVAIETIGQYINRNCDLTGEKIFSGMEVEFHEPGSTYAADKQKKTGVVKFGDCSFFIEGEDGVKYYRWMDYYVEIKRE